MALIVLLTLAMIAAVSLVFELWSFPWFAWCALGVLAMIIVPGAVLQVMPSDTNEGAFSIIGFYASLFVWTTFVAAITDAPSVSFFVLGVGTMLVLEDLIRLAIGPAPRRDGKLQSGDND